MSSRGPAQADHGLGHGRACLMVCLCVCMLVCRSASVCVSVSAYVFIVVYGCLSLSVSDPRPAQAPAHDQPMLQFMTSPGPDLRLDRPRPTITERMAALSVCPYARLFVCRFFLLCIYI